MYFTIAAINPGEENRTIIFQSSSQDYHRGIYGVKLSLDIEKAGSLSFTVDPENVFYDMFAKGRTFIIVSINERILDPTDTEFDIVFGGMVTDISTDIFKQKSITVTDAITFLEDSIYIPSNGDINDTPAHRLQEAIINHNEQMSNDVEKQISGINIGEIAGINTSKLFNDNSYQTTYAYIKSELIDQYGGYLRLRYVWNGRNKYLDYLPTYGTTASQTVEFGKNIITCTCEDSSEDIFTVLIPTGNDNLDLTSAAAYDNTIIVKGKGGDNFGIRVIHEAGSRYLRIHKAEGWASAGIDKYGYIYKNESFTADTANDVDDQTTHKDGLLSQAIKYLINNYHPEQMSFKVTMIDWNYMDASARMIKLGDKCHIVYGVDDNNNPLSEDLICSAINYDMLDPGASEYTFGSPNQTFTEKVAKQSNASAKQASSATSSVARTVENRITDHQGVLMDSLVTLLGPNYVSIVDNRIVLNPNSLGSFTTICDAINSVIQGGTT